MRRRYKLIPGNKNRLEKCVMQNKIRTSLWRCLMTRIFPALALSLVASLFGLAVPTVAAQEADVMSLPAHLSVRPALPLPASSQGLFALRDRTAPAWVDQVRQHDLTNSATAYSASMRYAWQQASVNWAPVSLGPVQFGGMARSMQLAYSPRSNAMPYLLMPVAAANFRLWGQNVGANFAWLPNLNKNTADPNRLVVQFRVPLD